MLEATVNVKEGFVLNAAAFAEFIRVKDEDDFLEILKLTVSEAERRSELGQLCSYRTVRYKKKSNVDPASNS